MGLDVPEQKAMGMPAVLVAQITHGDNDFGPGEHRHPSTRPTTMGMVRCVTVVAHVPRDTSHAKGHERNLLGMDCA